MELIFQQLHPHCILKTPRIAPVVKSSGGEYTNFGLEKSVQVALFQVQCDKLKNTELPVTIDGLISLWSVLCNVPKISSKPSVVAVYCGNKKPESHDFLRVHPGVKYLQTNGTEIKGPNVQLQVRCIICD